MNTNTIYKIAIALLLGVIAFMLFHTREVSKAVDGYILASKATVLKYENQKAADKITIDSLEIASAEKDSIILVLSKKETLFLTNLNNNKNETSKNIFRYLNSSDDVKFQLFARLITEADTPKSRD